MASSFKFNYNRLITTTQGTHMMQVVCQLQSTRTLENSQDFCFGPSRSVPIFLKFKPGPGATDFRGQARFRLQFRLEPGGSMVHSSLQLQPNKSTAGVPVNLGRAGPRWRPSLVARLAESLRTEDGAGAPVSPRTWSLFLSWAAVLRHMADSKQPFWAPRRAARESGLVTRTVT